MGVIDPTLYVHAGTPYVLWKDDGNDVGKPSVLWMQQLDVRAFTVRGAAHELLRNDEASWEGTVVEGPWMIERRGFFYLFYSGACYADETYGLGVARSQALLGPYEKAPTNPILKTSANRSNPFSGPGHASILETDEGEFYALYHAWVRDERNEIYYERGRKMLRDGIFWTDGGWPIVGRAGEPTYDAHSRVEEDRWRP